MTHIGRHRRSELFLARAAVLVEGLTEKLVLPLVFSALGYDADREAISIIECGGKPNIPLFARICRATGIPFLVLHDGDRKASGRLVVAERAVNALIAETAGADRVVVLDPDFEAIAGLHGSRRKLCSRTGRSSWEERRLAGVGGRFLVARYDTSGTPRATLFAANRHLAGIASAGRFNVSRARRMHKF